MDDLRYLRFKSQAELENTSTNQCMEQDMMDERLNCQVMHPVRR